MANSRYTQVIDLLTTGKLNWAGNNILALLLDGATFLDTDKRMSDLEGNEISRVPIQGRWVASGGLFMGYAVAFQRIAPGEYQVVVVQDDGTNDPNVLAWYDTNDADSPLTQDNDGTLVVRPVLPDSPPPDSPQESRVWMRVP